MNLLSRHGNAFPDTLRCEGSGRQLQSCCRSGVDAQGAINAVPSYKQARSGSWQESREFVAAMRSRSQDSSLQRRTKEQGPLRHFLSLTPARPPVQVEGVQNQTGEYTLFGSISIMMCFLYECQTDEGRLPSRGTRAYIPFAITPRPVSCAPARDRPWFRIRSRRPRMTRHAECSGRLRAQTMLARSAFRRIGRKASCNSIMSRR